VAVGVVPLSVVMLNFFLQGACICEAVTWAPIKECSGRVQVNDSNGLASGVSNGPHWQISEMGALLMHTL
jgi:hypothetical protein